MSRPSKHDFNCVFHQVLYLISAFSIFLVLLITVFVAKLRSTLFGRMKISVLTSMFSFYSFMTLIDFGGVSATVTLNYFI